MTINNQIRYFRDEWKLWSSVLANGDGGQITIIIIIVNTLMTY